MYFVPSTPLYVKHPDNVSKHNEVKPNIKNAYLSKYWTKTLATEHLFKLAERVDECDPADVLINSFINRITGWRRMARLPYNRLQEAHKEETGENAVYHCFAEIFIWGDTCTYSVAYSHPFPVPTGTTFPTLNLYK